MKILVSFVTALIVLWFIIGVSSNLLTTWFVW